MKINIDVVMKAIIIVAACVFVGSLVKSYVEVTDKVDDKPSYTQVMVDDLVKDSNEFCQSVYLYLEECEAE